MLNANGKLTRKLDRTISTRARGTEFAEAVREQLIKGENNTLREKRWSQLKSAIATQDLSDTRREYRLRSVGSPRK
jgi:hypothetical protein